MTFDIEYLKCEKRRYHDRRLYHSILILYDIEESSISKAGTSISMQYDIEETSISKIGTSILLYPGPRDLGRTVFFPVGTDRPARRRPAALDRPGSLQSLFLGRRLRTGNWAGVLSAAYIFYAVGLFQGARRSPSSLRLQVISTGSLPVPHLPARMLCTTCSTVPQGHAWYQPPCNRCRGGSGDPRRAAPRRPQGPAPRRFGTSPSGSICPRCAPLLHMHRPRCLSSLR